MSMAGHGPSTSTHEHGSLAQTSSHESRFIGSSSGIYFINTVKQAFDESLEHSRVSAVEETVGGEDDYASSHSSSNGEQAYQATITSGGTINIDWASVLGPHSSYENAEQLAINYFRTWHPLVPFLSGPEFLQELRTFYRNLSIPEASNIVSLSKERLCYLIIVQCVLGIGGCESLNNGCMLPRSELLALVASLAASTHDLLTVQTVLAAQVYCISTMALRAASTLGGILSKLLYHAGLHRCPYKYPQISRADCELRKRVIWSSFALDRYICQALGIPVSLTESEIDVCIPGRSEIHLVDRDPQAYAFTDEIGLSDPATSNHSREIILSNFVEYGKLVGHVLELFHMSLPYRSKDPHKILLLRSDVNRWFNSLPEEPTLTKQSNLAETQIARFLPFFHVLYEQLLILINRPSLSLPRTRPEFHHGIQVTIRAAKKTAVALERQANLFWPGYLASVWMSGLIISFACQIGLYNIDQGSREIIRCLDLLKRMAGRWPSAQRCFSALSTLLSRLRLSSRRPHSTSFDGEATLDQPSKRQRTDLTSTGSLADEISGPASTDQMSSETPGNAILVSAPSETQGLTQWDVNDFFRDLSWNNLFDISDIAQGPDDLSLLT